MIPVSPLEALRALRARIPGPLRLYVAGGTGEPLAMVDAFQAEPELARDVTFVGIWIPGINTTDWANLHETARAETVFLSADLRASFEVGKTQFRPQHYTHSYDDFLARRCDAVIAMVTPPDAQGQVSLGVSVDFTLAAMADETVPVIGLINMAMPEPADTARFPVSRLWHVAQCNTPLVQMPMVDLPPVFDTIGANISELVRDGDTLQFGLGNVQQAVLGALRAHKNLRVYSGMVSDPLVGLLDAGAIMGDTGAVTTGVAAGTCAIYERAAEDRRFRFRSVRHTHHISKLGAIPNLRAINSAIEVDLFGQANAEFIQGRQVSGIGGLVEFLRGAAVSDGGTPITALASTARKGRVSRIVLRLPPNATSVGRNDMGVVVTEHGVADLRGCTVDTRATALIEIADPSYRDALSNGWDDLRRAM